MAKVMSIDIKTEECYNILNVNGMGFAEFNINRKGCFYDIQGKI